MSTNDGINTEKMEYLEASLSLHIPRKYLDEVKGENLKEEILSLQKPIDQVIKTIDRGSLDVSAKIANNTDIGDGKSVITIALVLSPKGELGNNSDVIPYDLNFTYTFNRYATSKEDFISYIEKLLEGSGISLDKSVR